MKIPCICVALCLLACEAGAQDSGLRLRTAGAGMQAHRMNLPLNHVYLVDYHMKDPDGYMDYINQISMMSDEGHDNRHLLKEFVFTAEFCKPGSSSRFWKHYTVEAGLAISTRVDKFIGAFERFDAEILPTELVQQFTEYRISRRQRYAGVSLTLYRKFRLSPRLTSYIGLRAQPGLAISNTFKSDWHAYIYRNYQYSESTDLRAQDWKGRNYYQGQATVPIGLEWESKSMPMAFRMNLSAGVMTINLHERSFLSQYIYGAGFSVLYKPGEFGNKGR